MSESDTIKVTIDDSELDAALAKIQQIVALSEEATATAGAAGGGARGLPGINREVRLLLSQIPGMREAQQVYFALSRMVRGFSKGGVFLYLSLLATAVLIFRQVMDILKKNEKDRQQYEAWIRRERKLSHDEFVALEAQWKNIARNRPG